MTIALIAHDSKKELMVQFCTAYCRILSQHKLVATGTTGKLISEATGLQIQRFLAGVQGGDQQIASRIACNEVDLLLFFRDPSNAQPSEPNELTLLRLAMYELLYRQDVPAKVAINEALELTRQFGEDNATSFVNGILDAAAKALEKGSLSAGEDSTN